MKPYTTIISTTEFAENLHNPDWVVVDCRHVLTNPQQGQQDYQASHILGAVFAHLEHDLAGAIVPGKTGRHPLPDPAKLVSRLQNWGIGNATQVVVYDQMGGAFAARLWWMLRWLGHSAVAVLDGGWQAWLAAGLPCESGVAHNAPRLFTANLQPNQTVSLADVQANLRTPTFQLLDARSADRFHGENETIDPKGGHIPHALNAPFADNLTPEKTFAQPKALRSRFQNLLGNTPVENVVAYCGSAVTACHNLLALEIAGLHGARLFPGSWSEWCTLPDGEFTAES
jgi:thiosulfate/3-mercaptopyruvate sulfurtransferase